MNIHFNLAIGVFMKLMSKILVLSLASTVTLSAIAEVNQPTAMPVVKDVDLSYAFGDDVQDLQILAMTSQEMDETQGAALWFAPAIAGGVRFVLTGFTRHGLNQAISRQGVGVSNKAILNTMRNPTKITSQPGGVNKFTGPNGSVVLNSEGKVITTWGKPR